MQTAIKNITGISPDERSMLMYDNGLYYLHILCRGYDAVADEISRSKTFWQWWRWHWEMRDGSFYDSIQEQKKRNHGLAPAIARQLYDKLHCPIALSCELSLNGQLLSESYANMIGKLNRESREAVRA